MRRIEKHTSCIREATVQKSRDLHSACELEVYKTPVSGVYGVQSFRVTEVAHLSIARPV